MLIVFVGMPASGKSTVGKRVAQHLDFEFIDLDAHICDREECQIPEIFEKGGEDLFRKAEQAALKSILQRKNLVVSTGGGTPCFFDNMEQINQCGLSIYLRLPIETIATRIMADKKNIRPLYDNKSRKELLQYLTELFQKRRLFYEKSHLSL